MAVAVSVPQVAVTFTVAEPDLPGTGLTTPDELTVTGASAAGLSMLHVYAGADGKPAGTALRASVSPSARMGSVPAAPVLMLTVHSL